MGGSPGTRRATVFLSYSSADHDVAATLADTLRSAGLTVFFGSDSVGGGENYASEITRAIASCEIVVVLLSASSIASPHVQREVSLAVDERRVLLPLTLPGVSYPSHFDSGWIYWLGPVNATAYAGPGPTLAQVRALRERRSDQHLPGVPRGAGTRARRKLGSSRRRPAGPTSLLRPEARLPELMGLDTELARLQEWCRRPEDFGIRLVTGRAGQGKSRLAHEFACGLADAGWSVANVGPDENAAEIAAHLPDNPHLLIVDYAEARADQLISLITELAVTGVPDTLRLLLLARTAGDWWRALVARDPEVGEWLSDATIQPLPDLVTERAAVDALYISAKRDFRRVLQLAEDEETTSFGAPYRTYESVLDVLEDALASVLGETGGASPGISRLLAHERRYLQAAAVTAGVSDLDEMELEQLAAALTLYGAATEGEALAVVEACCPEIGPADHRRLVRLFRRIFPGHRGYTDGLRPDRLAEDLIAGVTLDNARLPGAEDGLHDIRHTAEQRRRALTVLARGAPRHPVLAAELTSTLESADVDLLIDALGVASQVEEPGRVIAALERVIESQPPDVLEALFTAVPSDTVALADVAARMANRLLPEMRDTGDGAAGDPSIAIRCSNVLSDAGWPSEAAEAARLTVDLLRSSHDECSLGRALTNLSNRLWELGLLDASLDPAQQAVEVLRAATAAPAELAGASTNLAFRLAEHGRFDEALAHALLGDELCRRESTSTDVTWRKTQGAVWNNLACIKLALGEAAEALDYAVRGVELRRSQAVRSRDQFLVFLARSMTNAAPAAEACDDTALAERLIAEARYLHELTAERAPILRFEQAESTALDALLHLSRADWDQAATIASTAERQLRMVDADIGVLRGRLGTTIEMIRRAAADEQAVSVLSLATGAVPDLHLPRLMEYRDL